MTIREWFAGVFDRAMARWVGADPDRAEALVGGLLDRVLNIQLVWDTIASWLDNNPEKVAPFIVQYLDGVAAGSDPAPPEQP